LQIGAEDIDAGLTVFPPVVSQARHGVHPRQADSGLIVAQLLGRRGEPLVQGPGALFPERPVQLRALLRERRLGAPGRRAASEVLRGQRAYQRQHADTCGDRRRDDRRVHTRNLADCSLARGVQFQRARHRVNHPVRCGRSRARRHDAVTPSAARRLAG
jgi:hypothetical protein